MGNELKILLGIIIFMFSFNIILGYVIPDAYDYNDTNSYFEQFKNALIDEESSWIGQITGYAFAGLFGLIFATANFWFSLFGVQLIVNIPMMPSWFNAGLFLVNITGISAIIFYIIDLVWIG